MNQYGILKMAREAGLLRGGEGWTEPHRWGITEIERFAHLIEQHLSYDGIHTCHAECQRPACVAVREAVALAVEPLQFRITDLYRQLDEAEKRLDEQYKLGIEAEREACAQLCEEYVVPVSIAGAHPDYLIGKQMAFQQVARAIRARGEK
jgi:hypothetical protein